MFLSLIIFKWKSLKKDIYSIHWIFRLVEGWPNRLSYTASKGTMVAFLGSLEICIKNPKIVYPFWFSNFTCRNLSQGRQPGIHKKTYCTRIFTQSLIIKKSPKKKKKSPEENKYSIIGNWLYFIVYSCCNIMQT